MRIISESQRLRKLNRDLQRERSKTTAVTDKETYGETRRFDGWDFVHENLDLPREA